MPGLEIDEIMMKKLRSVVLFGVLSAGCSGVLDPTAKVDGLEFTGEANVVNLGQGEDFLEATVRVRNVAGGRIGRTYDGGCFIRRLQAFLEVGSERRLAWDSDRDPNRGCTDDLALLDLAPGEEASPHNWRASVRLAEVRDSFPAGQYEIVIHIQAGDRQIRAGTVQIP